MTNSKPGDAAIQREYLNKVCNFMFDSIVKPQPIKQRRLTVPDFSPTDELAEVEFDGFLKKDGKEYLVFAKGNLFYNWIESCDEDGKSEVLHHEYNVCPLLDNYDPDIESLKEYLTIMLKDFMKNRKS